MSDLAARFPPEKGVRSGRLRGTYTFVILGFVLAVLLVMLSWFAFHGSSADTFRRRFAEVTLQLALVVILGALIKLLVDDYTARVSKAEEDRAAELSKAEQDHAAEVSKAEQDQAKREDLLRRVRAQHVKVAYAQRLILAHNSGKTYTEQLRKLMMVAPDLEDIAEDVRAAKSLLSLEDAETILSGLKGMVEYLEEGAQEYIKDHVFVDEDARAGRRLEFTRSERNMSWVGEFITSSPSFPKRYADSVTMSKGTLRRLVYSQ